MGTQSAMKTIIVENFILSAKAPTIRAGVMIAKVNWNGANPDSGFDQEIESTEMRCKKVLPRPPTIEFKLTTPASIPVVSKAML